MDAIIPAMRTLASIAAVALCASGCGDQCRDGESICSDNHPIYCVQDIDSTAGEPWDFSSQGNDCALGSHDRCVDTKQGDLRVAVCSTSGRPDPRCAAAGEKDLCFDTATKLICSEGYSQERDCEGACVADEHGAFCSTEAAPNPACPTSEQPTCDGSSVITCHAGYVIDRIACASTCITSAANVPFCSDGTACSAADGATCDGSTLHGCIAGQTVAMTCNAGSECNDFAQPPDFIVEAECTPYGY